MIKNTNRILNVAVGTVKKSMEQVLNIWFFRKVRHVCEGGFGCEVKELPRKDDVYSGALGV